MNYKDTLMWKEISETERAIAGFNAVNAKTIADIVADTEKHGVKNVCLAGRGTSDHALFYFKYLVEIMSGYTAGYVAPSVVTMYDGKVDFSDNLVIGCSQSGYAADVIAVIERAKEQGAVTVAVTNDADSPLAKAAEYHIYLNAGKEVSVAATKTFSVQLYAMLNLACALAHRDDLVKKYASLSEKVAKFAVEADKFTSADADRLKDIKDGFILARGLAYPIAFEGSLKLQETCYIRMRGYAMSDFYHGPMAMVDEGTHVFVYVPEYTGGSAELAAAHVADVKRCLDKLTSLKADVTLVTDSKAYDCYKGAAHIDEFAPFGDENEAMFAFALYAQMLACKISCAIGNNPDSPKSLNKVTVTR